MRAFMFEGTPEEVTEAMKKLGAGSVGLPATSTSAKTDGADDGDDDDDEVEYVDVGVARRTVTRIPLSNEQKIVLKTLYGAGEDGVLASKLQSLTKYSKGQFAGLMGAFGRRVSHTRGYVDGSLFFRQDWDDEEGCYRYWLPETVRDAVKRELID
jgi:hypothetical protein